jgi:Glyoxalase/Bleomycin resistance protein/Dioxygenase superfamily
MKTLGFGQSVGQIIQMAYVVKDIHAAMAWWGRDAKAGPWFLLPHFLGPDQLYKGAPSTADVAIAMGFAGHMQIELIQPLDDNPSVYRDAINARGYGFHHVGVAFEDVDAEIPAYEARGYTLDFRAAVPTGGSVAYMRAPDATAPGYVELIPATAGMDALFTTFWQAAQDWDGSAPVRPFG